MKLFKFKNRKKRSLLLLMACGLFILAFWQNGYACPGCSTIESGSVGRGLNLSVIFMIMMPFFVAGSAAAGVIFFIKNQDKSSTNSKTTYNPHKQGGQIN